MSFLSLPLHFSLCFPPDLSFFSLLFFLIHFILLLPSYFPSELLLVYLLISRPHVLYRLPHLFLFISVSLLLLSLLHLPSLSSSPSLTLSLHPSLHLLFTFPYISFYSSTSLSLPLSLTTGVSHPTGLVKSKHPKLSGQQPIRGQIASLSPPNEPIKQARIYNFDVITL